MGNQPKKQTGGLPGSLPQHEQKACSVPDKEAQPPGQVLSRLMRRAQHFSAKIQQIVSKLTMTSCFGLCNILPHLLPKLGAAGPQPFPCNVTKAGSCSCGCLWLKQELVGGTTVPRTNPCASCFLSLPAGRLREPPEKLQPHLGGFRLWGSTPNIIHPPECAHSTGTGMCHSSRPTSQGSREAAINTWNLLLLNTQCF